jgi:hypothetical protein
MDKHRLMDLEDTEEMIIPSLWGAHVTEANPVPLEPHEQRFTLFRATLEKGNKAQLFISIKGTKYALGTLTKDKKEYTKLEIEIFEGTDDVSEISVVGDGTVALVGAYSPALFNDGDEDDFGSLSDFDDDDDEEEPQLMESKPAKVLPVKGQPSPKGPQPAKQTQPKTPNQPKVQTQAPPNKPPTQPPAQQPGAKKPPAKGGKKQTPPKPAAGANKPVTAEPNSPKPAAPVVETPVKQSPKKEEIAEISKTPEKSVVTTESSSAGSVPDTQPEEKTQKSETSEEPEIESEMDQSEEKSATTPKPQPGKGKKKTPQAKKQQGTKPSPPAGTKPPGAKPNQKSPVNKPNTPAAKRAAGPGAGGGPAKKKKN